MTTTISTSNTTDRFWQKVITAGPDECWSWIGAKTEFGYGVFYAGGGRRCMSLVRAHRFSYEIQFGPIAKGKFVLHQCDNPSCVNPKHLQVGDAADNMRECIARKRHRALRGEDHRDARLTESDVKRIREWRRGENLLHGETRLLGEIFGVSSDHVRKIRSGKKWRHVG